MKKILVPTDFSKYSENALNVAATIAKEQNAEILVLHMLGLSQSGLNKNANRGAAEAIFHLKLAEKEFGSLLDKDYLKGLTVNEKVENYTNFIELNQLALDNNIDLIVMGSHGASGLEEAFVGSNTEKVVRTSDTPVLVVKNRIKDFKAKEVVFACDFKVDSINAYRSAVKLFKSFNSNIHLLYVNLPHRFITTKQMKKNANEFISVADSVDMKNLDNVVFYNDSSVEEGIHNYCETINADLVVIPTHGRRGLAHFFNGSISEDIANHEGRPVMTFKIK